MKELQENSEFRTFWDGLCESGLCTAYELHCLVTPNKRFDPETVEKQYEK